MKLTIIQINKLRKIKRFRHWLDQYALVEFFEKKHGRFPYSREEFPTGNKLGKWYNDYIRYSYRKGRLKLWQVYLLNKFNYKFDLPDRWKLNFDALKKGWVEHPESWPYVYYYSPNLKRIEKWCKDQRLYYSKGTLSQDKIDKLNSIKFVWDQPGDVCWKNHYENILTWIIKNNCSPKRYSSDSKERFYAAWIAKERSKINFGKIKKDRAIKIETLCRITKYDPIKFDWDDSYSLYINWYNKHGKKPNKRSVNIHERRFGYWFNNQTVLLNKGLLSKEHTDKFIKLKKMLNQIELIPMPAKQKTSMTALSNHAN